MDQNINVKLFLQLDHFADFLLNSLHILFFGDPVSKHGDGENKL